MQNTPRDQRYLSRLLSEIQRRLRALETAPRAGHTSISHGKLLVRDGETGDVIVSMATADDTDEHGNEIPQGLSASAGSVTGGIIQPGTIDASKVNFTSRDISGVTTTTSDTAPTGPVVGDLWIDTANGNLVKRWDGSTWTELPVGTDAIQAGAVTASQIAANTITAGQLAAGAVTAAKIAAGAIDGQTITGATVKSPNYVAGSAGYSINPDGSAEFNNVTTRGPVDVTGTDGSRVFIHTEAGANAGITMQPPATPGANYHPGSIATESNGATKETDLVITSPCETSGTALTSQIVMEGSDGTRPNPLIKLDATDVLASGNVQVDGGLSVSGGLNIGGDMTGAGNVDILGILSAANIAFGQTTITPSGTGGVPTSKAVSFGPLEGTTFFGFVTANTSVPGTTVTGVGIQNVTSTGATVWLTRTNNTPTGVFWLVIGI